MNTLQQAFVNGFVKRAAQHGINEIEAVGLLKTAIPKAPVRISPPAPEGQPRPFRLPAATVRLKPSSQEVSPAMPPPQPIAPSVYPPMPSAPPPTRPFFLRDRNPAPQATPPSRGAVTSNVMSAAPGLVGAADNALQGNFGHAALDALMGVGAGLGNALSKSKVGRIGSMLAGYLGPKAHHYLQQKFNDTNASPLKAPVTPKYPATYLDFGDDLDNNF